MSFTEEERPECVTTPRCSKFKSDDMWIHAPDARRATKMLIFYDDEDIDCVDEFCTSNTAFTSLNIDDVSTPKIEKKTVIDCRPSILSTADAHRLSIDDEDYEGDIFDDNISYTVRHNCISPELTKNIKCPITINKRRRDSYGDSLELASIMRKILKIS
ncbi:hypothetical protein ACR3K2_36300 [Cryptosporidium serpentis]